MTNDDPQVSRELLVSKIDSLIGELAEVAKNDPLSLSGIILGKTHLVGLLTGWSDDLGSVRRQVVDAITWGREE